MTKMQSVKLSGTDDECEKVLKLLAKNRRALNSLFKAELGRECDISDMEMIGDALHSQMALTRTAVRVLMAKKLED